MHTIIELTGTAQAGKTTFATLFGEELSEADILYIDASSNMGLSGLLAVDPPELTVSQLFGSAGEAPGHRESLDWAFHDLTVPAGEGNELLALGALGSELSPVDLEKFRYGITRLINNYDCLIIDGHHPLLHACLPVEFLRTLNILQPNDLGEWTRTLTQETDSPTPSILLNGDQQAAFPEALEEALITRRIQLIGKIPFYASPQMLNQRLAGDFHECLLRLDLPLLKIS